MSDPFRNTWPTCDRLTHPERAKTSFASATDGVTAGACQISSNPDRSRTAHAIALAACVTTHPAASAASPNPAMTSAIVTAVPAIQDAICTFAR
jgi:hypothetical protein